MVPTGVPSILTSADLALLVILLLIILLLIILLLIILLLIILLLIILLLVILLLHPVDQSNLLAKYSQHLVDFCKPDCCLATLELRDESLTDTSQIGQFVLIQLCCLPSAPDETANFLCKWFCVQHSFSPDRE